MSSIFDISTPEKREKFLLVVGAIVFVVVMLPILFQLFGSEVSKRRLERNRLKTEVAKLEEKVKDQKTIKRRLDDLTARSLPSNDNSAIALYQNWLMQLATDVGIEEKRVDRPSSTQIRTQNKNQYQRFTFTLHGRGNLEQISEFLRCFHNTNYLHLIRKVSPKPIKNSRDMEVSITVEALSLPQARSSRTLPSLEGNVLYITQTERDMRKNITDRALFSVYTPPRPEGTPAPAAPTPNRFDHSPYCFVTAVVEVDDKPQVWVDIRTEGKKHKLFEGDMFRLGTVRCYVKKIEFDRVQFEAVGELYTIKIGNSFAEYE